MVILNACSSFPILKCKRVYLLFLLLCAASVFGKTPGSLQSLDYEGDTMVSSELDPMMSSDNCTNELKNKCRTEFAGNDCSVDENDYFNCTCNAVGFETAKNGKSCLQVNCSSDANSKCRTDVDDNFCFYNGFVSQCICHADGFRETNRRTQCLRSYCTKKEEKMCLTHYGNDCKISNDTQECFCYDVYQATNNRTHCKRVKCSFVDMRRCKTNYSANKCTFSDVDYKCQCDNNEFRPTKDEKDCLGCEAEHKYNCQVSEITGNSCNMTDIGKYVCICKLPFSVLSEDSRSCLRVECTTAEKNRCDPFDEGNSCYISNGIFNCNCTSPNSAIGPNVEITSCMSKLCGDFRDKFACRVDIEGNTCSFPDGMRRKCTCNAPGYTLVSSSLSEALYNDTCWRNECTSYEEDACQTLITGNTCGIVDDVHKCTCNAPRYQAEAPKLQRCLNEWDIWRRTTTHRSVDE